MHRQIKDDKVPESLGTVSVTDNPDRVISALNRMRGAKLIACIRSEDARIDYALITVSECKERNYLAQFEIMPIKDKDKVALTKSIIDDLLDYHVISHLD